MFYVIAFGFVGFILFLHRAGMFEPPKTLVNRRVPELLQVINKDRFHAILKQPGAQPLRWKWLCLARGVIHWIGSSLFFG
jgi:hypothetical protein